MHGYNPGSYREVSFEKPGYRDAGLTRLAQRRTTVKKKKMMMQSLENSKMKMKTGY